ncbi:MAG: apolipoprotein N-acyltransferase [Cytophagales bacterium]|nr:apolipoprotein N-acyltransferase [Armatimonadota bacterium]
MDALTRGGRSLVPLAPAVLSALLLTLAFAPLGWWWAAWVALIPLYTSFANAGAVPQTPKKERDSRSGTRGFAFGTFLFLVGMFWMNEIGAVPWFVLACIQAIPFAILGALAAALLPRLPPWARPFAFAALWTLLEFARSYGRYAFPWFLLSTSQTNSPPILQLVSVTGQWGLSFCVAAANGFGGEAWLAWRRGSPSGLAVRLAAAGIGTPTALLLSGLSVIASVQKSENGLPTRVVGLAQGSIKKEDYGDSENRQRVLTTYLNLTRDAVLQGQGDRLDRRGQPRGIAFVAWPETVVPGYITQNPSLRGALSETARALRTPLLVGAPEVDEDGNWRNTAFLFDRNGLEQARYDKNQLVPIGEFFPLRGVLGPIYARYGVPDQDHASGNRLGIMDLGGISPETKLRVGTIICYESVFPNWARDDVRGGAQVIVLLTSDQTFGTSAGPRQHADIAAVRAVETRRWMVRAASTGVSEFLDPSGQVRDALPLTKRGVLVHSVTLRDDRTLYVRWGDWALWVCAGIVAACVIAARRSVPSAPEFASEAGSPPEQTSRRGKVP